MPFGSVTCGLRTNFKDVHVLNVLFSYSLIKKNDVIPACKIWIMDMHKQFNPGIELLEY